MTVTICHILCVTRASQRRMFIVIIGLCLVVFHLSTCGALQAVWLCDSNNHTLSVLPQGLAFVFAPEQSHTAVSSISLSGIMRRHRGQIVPPNLLAGEKGCHDES